MSCHQNESDMIKITNVFDIWISKHCLSLKSENMISNKSNIALAFNQMSYRIFGNELDNIRMKYDSQIQQNIYNHKQMIESMKSQMNQNYVLY